MSRIEEVELTNMCMICDDKGNVLVQNKSTIHEPNENEDLKRFWIEL